MIPGEILPASGDIELNAGLARTTLVVANTGDRPIQVGSHYHFAETNPALSFDRAAARGMTAGHPRWHCGPIRARPDTRNRASALPRQPRGAGLSRRRDGSTRLMAHIPRAAYADMFGPTTGDRVRLADTDLIVEVERDLTIYGEEVKFGGGKVIRDGMGQSQASQAEGAVDTVITNALIIDHWGIIKADVAHHQRAHHKDRQGRQSRCAAERRYHYRSGHRGDRRRGQDPHRWRHRQPHPFHLSAAGRGCDRRRHDHADRRRHRALRQAPLQPPARPVRGILRACCRRPRDCR